jgi:hypothetical protein
MVIERLLLILVTYEKTGSCNFYSPRPFSNHWQTGKVLSGKLSIVIFRKKNLVISPIGNLVSPGDNL